jgi:hypothetical protein
MKPTIFAIEYSNSDFVFIHLFRDEAIDVTTLALSVANEITDFHYNFPFLCVLATCVVGSLL